MIRTIGWPIFIIVMAVISAGASLVNSGSPLRAVVGFLFLLVCPGAAWVRLLGIGDILTEVSLSIALSIALGVAVTEVMLYTQLWSPHWGLLALIGLSMIGVAVQMVAAYRRLTADVLLREGGAET
jgi:uncharacterized membrane protein